MWGGTGGRRTRGKRSSSSQPGWRVQFPAHLTTGSVAIHPVKHLHPYLRLRSATPTPAQRVSFEMGRVVHVDIEHRRHMSPSVVIEPTP